MVTIVKFKREHLESMNGAREVSFAKQYLTKEHVAKLEKVRHSYAILQDEKVLACCGVVEHWNGRGEGWAIISGELNYAFIRMHRIVKRFLDWCDIKRIEAIIDTDFKEGHRWAKALGFKMEAPLMKSYGYTGKDCTLYARVK